MKRALSLLLSIVLLLLVMLLPVSGASSMSFIVVNDLARLNLTGDQRPFYSGGALYVPYTVFSSVSLGFYPSYSVADKTLALFSRDKRLVFDLSDGTVTDETKYVQNISAVSKAGTVFVPAAFCAGHFGIRVSDLTSKDGYQIVRFTTGSEIFDDNLLVERAEPYIARAIQTQSTEDPSTTTSPSTPTVPTTPNTPDGQTTPDTQPEQHPARIYLAITGAGGLENARNALDRHRLKATFFLTAEEIAANEAMVRRLSVEGHYIGLTADAAEDVPEQLALADLALDRTLQSRSLLALLPEGRSSEAVSARYRVFEQPATVPSATQAAKAYGQAQLFVCDSETLSAKLQILTAADCQFLPLRETSQPNP